ncbi:MAG TPA: sulfite exporter TauE/SafE family protein [Beijerinckiaceae bacterium]|jgi:hypothetical protein
MNELAVLSVAGFIAGVMNAMAGGGTFVTIPALVWAGTPALVANASSTVALFPGQVASNWAYRQNLSDLGAVSLRSLLIVSILGGLAGALLLLLTPTRAFEAIIPWLLLLATLTFAFGARAGVALRRHLRIGPASLLAAQFVLAIYGGYFGGGVGIMMMAAWSLLQSADLRIMTPARTCLVAATNAIAVLCFVIAGIVEWAATLAILVAAVAGGYAGARLALVMNVRVLRAVILIISSAMTLAFFQRSY